MKKIKPLLSLCGLLFVTPCLAQTDNLLSVYQTALVADPTLQAAEAAMEAGQWEVPIALSRFLPTLSGSANTTGHNDTGGFQSQDYNTKGYTVSLTQPIWHRENLTQYQQAKHNQQLAVTSYAVAIQDLMIRVSERYFAILAAEDEVTFTNAQRKAFERELEQTSQRYDVGLIAVTEVDEARARRDEARAAEIAAKNEVANQYEQLREITGVATTTIATLKPKALQLNPPSPNQLDTWVTVASEESLDLLLAKLRAWVARADIANQAAGHWPSLDVNAAYARNYDNRLQAPISEDTISRSANLTLNVPMFQGGNVIFRTKQARANYEQAQKNYEVQYRRTHSTTRQSFRGVITEISRVKALQQAVKSNNSALKATQAAYQAGTRTLVDVLDAESSLLSAKRDYSQARYRYILEGLRLKRAAGTLSNDDIIAINTLLHG